MRNLDTLKLRLGVGDILDVAGYVEGCGNPGSAWTAPPVAERTAPAIRLLLDASAAIRRGPA